MLRVVKPGIPVATALTFEELWSVIIPLPQAQVRAELALWLL